LASRKEQREEARRQREEREAEERSKQRRKRRLWQVGATLAVAVVIIVIAIAVSSSGGNDTKVTTTEGKQTSNLFTGIAQTNVTLGNPQAKVTVYEFADLQCPFCREFTVGKSGNGSDAVFPQIVNKYVKPGKVKMVFRNLTFIGPDSVTAARAASAAGAQNKLWDFADLFYKNQGTENSGYVTDKFIEQIATNAGVPDVNKMKADQSAPFVEQQLGEAQNQAQQFGINSTPSFLIQVGNGKLEKLNYQNFQLSEFSGPIDAALQKAGA
jgi:protein-disulfide isomerase